MAYRLVRLCERAPVLRFNVSYEVEEWYWLGVVKALDTLGKGLIFSTPVIMVVGFGMLAYQGLFWLTHGIWKPITVFQVLQDVLPLNFLYWFVVQPTDWLGVWKLTGFIMSCSAWWVLIALSALLVVPFLMIGLFLCDTAESSRIRQRKSLQT